MDCVGTHIQINAEGLTIACDPPVVLQWSDVVEIVAYKRDLLTTDLVCVGFRLHGTDDLIEIDEEMPGFDLTMAAVATRFQLPDKWWVDVAIPAFATNETTIWPIVS